MTIFYSAGRTKHCCWLGLGDDKFLVRAVIHFKELKVRRARNTLILLVMLRAIILLYGWLIRALNSFKKKCFRCPKTDNRARGWQLWERRNETQGFSTPSQALPPGDGKNVPCFLSELLVIGQSSRRIQWGWLMMLQTTNLNDWPSNSTEVW